MLDLIGPQRLHSAITMFPFVEHAPVDSGSLQHCDLGLGESPTMVARTHIVDPYTLPETIRAHVGSWHRGRALGFDECLQSSRSLLESSHAPIQHADSALRST